MSYASENTPVTNEFVKEDFPTARKPRIATFLWTRVGVLFPLIDWYVYQNPLWNGNG